MWQLFQSGRRLARAPDVDPTDIGDGKTLVYHLASGTFRFVSVGVGDMTKAVYDADNNGIVDDSDMLDGMDGSFYLDRTNHTGVMPISAVSVSGVSDVSSLLGGILAHDGTQYQRLANAGTVAILGAASGVTQFYGSYPALNGSAITNLSGAQLDNLSVALDKLSGTGASTGQVPTWNGTAYAPATPSAGIGGSVGSVANGIPRASGTGGATLQASDLAIGDAATATQNNVCLENLHNGQSNSSLVLRAKGNGALIVGPPPDGSVSGGNARGTYAIDLQILRSAQSRVASGSSASIIGGTENTASGTHAIAGGYFNNATGTYSLALGYQNTASASIAMAFGRGATASHTGSHVHNCETGTTAVASDRANQFKVRATGGLTLVATGGTLTNWGKQSSAPVSGILSGDLYYDTGTNKMRCYDGSNWQDLW